MTAPSVVTFLTFVKPTWRVYIELVILPLKLLVGIALRKESSTG